MHTDYTPKFIANFLLKNLKGFDYQISANKTTTKKSMLRSYYLKSTRKNILTVRISNHKLHPTQERINTINLLLFEKELATINNVVVNIDENLKYKHLIVRIVKNKILENFIQN